MNGNENDYQPYNESDPEDYIRAAHIEDDYTREALRQAIWASVNSYSPYSKFPVGAAVVTEKGCIYSGCNIENASYGLTICADRTSIFQAVNDCGPKVKINEMVIYTPTVKPSAPCGACRQVIREFAWSVDNTVVRCYAKDPKTTPLVLTVKQLLPESFGPENL